MNSSTQMALEKLNDNVHYDVTTENFGSLISLSETRDKRFVNTQYNEIVNKLNEFRENNLFCDVTLIAGPEKISIPAHRLILNISSEYFLAMLSGGLLESKLSEIHLKKFRSDVIETIIDYCYGQKIEINSNNVVDLLITSSHMQFMFLVNACSDYLIQRLETKNCLGIYIFAWHHNLHRLANSSMAFAIQNIMHVCHNEEFLHLNVQHVIEILSRQDLNIEQEEQAFHLLIEWLKFDLKDRMKHVVQLLARIKLPLINPKYIEEYIEPLMTKIENREDTIAFQKILMNAYKSFVFDYRGTSLIPRICPVEQPKVLWAICSGVSRLVIEQFDSTRKIWTMWKKFTFPEPYLICDYEIVINNDQIFIIGGTDDNSIPASTVKCIDIRNQILVDYPPMKKCRFSHCAAVLHGFIYCIGGEDDRGVVLASVERYDTELKTWEFVASLNTGRTLASVVVLFDKLYVLGGIDVNRAPVKIIECYNPVVGDWEIIQNFECPEASTVTVMNGDFFIVRQCLTNNIQRYNKNLGSPESITKFRNHNRMSVEVLDDKLFVMNRDYPKLVSRINTSVDKWLPNLFLLGTYDYGVLKTVLDPNIKITKTLTTTEAIDS